MNKAVIWDLDGVIVDTKVFHWEAWQRLAAELGETFTEEQFLRTFGVRSDEIISSEFKGSYSKEDLACLFDRKEYMFREAAKGRLKPLPCVAELIHELHDEGFQLAVASSALRENVVMVVRELEVAECFQAIASGEEVEKAKPDPAVFLLAATKLRVPADCCVVIEDSAQGVEAAKAAGMMCVAVTNTRSPQALRAADLVVPSLCEVPAGDFDRLLASRRA